MKKLAITFLVILGVGISTDANAQFKDLKNLVGGSEEKEEKSGGDITAIQDALIADLTDALGDVLSAQALLAEAQGNKELASTLQNTADKMAGGDVSNDDIKGAVQQTAEAAELQQEEMNKKNNPILVQTINLSELSNFLGKPLSPYILELSELSESAFVKTWQPINLSSFRHFGYAVQWFGLAIVLIVGYVFFLRKGETKGNE